MASEFLRIAEAVLEREQRPRTPRQIIVAAARDGMLPDDWSGRTPDKTLTAKLSVDIRRKGERSAFVRSGKGTFFLRRLINPSEVYVARPLRPSKPKEEVLCFPSYFLSDIGRFQGLSTSHKRFSQRLFSSRLLSHVERTVAEASTDTKHIVTYVLVTRRGRILRFRRGNFSNTEQFLKGAFCIGFGGHVVASDIDLFSLQDYGIHASAVRELSEELRLPELDRLRIKDPEHLRLVGILNDDSSAVGRRHIAFVYRYEVSSSNEWNQPKPNEKAITQLRWVSPQEPSNNLFEYEYWSQLCLLTFFRATAATRPTYKLIRRRSFGPNSLICLIGSIGSGKTRAAALLKDRYGFTEINSGRVLAQLLGISPVSESTRAEFQREAWRFIVSPSGPSKLASELASKAEQLRKRGRSRLLIDGIRQRATLDALRQMLPRQVAAIYIHTPFHVAFQFYAERAGASTDIERFLNVRNAPVEQEVETLIADCDAVVYNWTGTSEYGRTVTQLMTDLGIERTRA